jgi:uncharacterized membrane protein YebE (DUF533 family)
MAAANPLAYGLAQVGHMVMGTRHGRWLTNRARTLAGIAAVAASAASKRANTAPQGPAAFAATPVAMVRVAQVQRPACVYLAHVQAQLNGAVSIA